MDDNGGRVLLDLLNDPSALESFLGQEHQQAAVAVHGPPADVATGAAMLNGGRGLCVSSGVSSTTLRLPVGSVSSSFLENGEVRASVPASTGKQKPPPPSSSPQSADVSSSADVLRKSKSASPASSGAASTQKRKAHHSSSSGKREGDVSSTTSGSDTPPRRPVETPCSSSSSRQRSSPAHSTSGASHSATPKHILPRGIPMTPPSFMTRLPSQSGGVFLPPATSLPYLGQPHTGKGGFGGATAYAPTLLPRPMFYPALPYLLPAAGPRPSPIYQVNGQAVQLQQIQTPTGIVHLAIPVRTPSAAEQAAPPVIPSSSLIAQMPSAASIVTTQSGSGAPPKKKAKKSSTPSPSASSSGATTSTTTNGLVQNPTPPALADDLFSAAMREAGIDEEDLREGPPPPPPPPTQNGSFIAPRPQVILGQGISIPPMVLPLPNGGLVIPQTKTAVSSFSSFLLNHSSVISSTTVSAGASTTSTTPSWSPLIMAPAPSNTPKTTHTKRLLAPAPPPQPTAPTQPNKPQTTVPTQQNKPQPTQQNKPQPTATNRQTVRRKPADSTVKPSSTTPPVPLLRLPALPVQLQLSVGSKTLPGITGSKSTPRFPPNSLLRNRPPTPKTKKAPMTTTTSISSTTLPVSVAGHPPLLIRPPAPLTSVVPLIPSTSSAAEHRTSVVQSPPVVSRKERVRSSLSDSPTGENVVGSSTASPPQPAVPRVSPEKSPPLVLLDETSSSPRTVQSPDKDQTFSPSPPLVVSMSLRSPSPSAKQHNPPSPPSGEQKGEEVTPQKSLPTPPPSSSPSPLPPTAPLVVPLALSPISPPESELKCDTPSPLPPVSRESEEEKVVLSETLPTTPPAEVVPFLEEVPPATPPPPPFSISEEFLKAFSSDLDQDLSPEERLAAVSERAETECENMDCTRPVCSRKDAFSRLVPWWVYNEPTPSAEEEQQQEDFFQTAAVHLLTKFQKMTAKLRRMEREKRHLQPEEPKNDEIPAAPAAAEASTSSSPKTAPLRVNGFPRDDEVPKDPHDRVSAPAPSPPPPPAEGVKVLKWTRCAVPITAHGCNKQLPTKARRERNWPRKLLTGRTRSGSDASEFLTGSDPADRSHIVVRTETGRQK
ncbi:unnamed protein product [Cyprideis torosa]|uniref:Uncharacterized protein n=1 Tax=Cyprideis torosa TaxID=163714 RepID=A0A7R8WG68_9CRUS|nr:unnamed protein product [Cyprideis torosa]CAG0896233.1 unnamed protein product [Cyprideis torosa]